MTGIAHNNETVTTTKREVSALLEFIRESAEKHGGVTPIARETGLSRESLYRALSPTIKTLCMTLSAMGMKIDITPARQSKE